MQYDSLPFTTCRSDQEADRLDSTNSSHCTVYFPCQHLQNVCMIDIWLCYYLIPKKAIAMHVFLQARTVVWINAVLATIVGTHHSVWEHQVLRKTFKAGSVIVLLQWDRAFPLGKSQGKPQKPQVAGTWATWATWA